MKNNKILRYFSLVAKDEAESLEKHDRKYHPNGYKDGDVCNKRSKMKRGDRVDRITDSEERMTTAAINKMINGWGVNNSQKEVESKFEKFIEVKRLNLWIMKTEKKSTTAGKEYYLVTAGTPYGDFRSEKMDEEISKAFKGRALRNAEFFRTYARYEIPMPGKDFLDEEDKLVSNHKALDIMEIASSDPDDWTLSEKSEADVKALQIKAVEKPSNKMMLNMLVNDFGGRQIRLWKALVRAHEKGWLIGEGPGCEYLFNPITIKHIRISSGVSELASTIGIRNEGYIRM